MTNAQKPLTTKQAEALTIVGDGHGVVGWDAPNGNTCNALRKLGLINGRGWPSDPYKLTALGLERRGR
jgi:hypothetical protein